MEKIGIVSLYYQNGNYGGQLQSYALPRALQSLGFYGEQIRFVRDLDGSMSRKSRMRSKNPAVRVKAVGATVKHALKEASTVVSNYPVREQLRKRENAFRSFERSVPHSDVVYDEHSIAAAGASYDAFVCGSDVIWNAGVDPQISALGFAPSNKLKVAFAPSLGVGSIPAGWFDKYQQYLDRLDAISVREASVAKDLHTLMPNREVFCAADPTLLLSRNEWEQSCRPQQHDGYALCYLLGDSRAQRDRAAETARQAGLDLLTFPHVSGNSFRSCDRGFGDIQNYDADAFDFISLIRDAELIITDSFHAVVFSSIFHKKFIALDRMNGSTSKMGGRVRNYLASLGLEAQLAMLSDESWASFTDEIDYSSVDDRMGEIRDRSLTYLRNSLNR